MGVSGPKFADAIRKKRVQLERDLAVLGGLLEEAWLTRTRIEIAQYRAPAPRSSWTATRLRANGRVTLTLGWQDFGSGGRAAKLRFDRATLHHERLARGIQRRFRWLGGR